MKHKLIAFAGRKRSGKGMLSNAIVDYNNHKNTVILTVASYLKTLCCELLNIDIDTLIKWKDNGHTFEVKPNLKWYNLIHNKTSIPIEIIENEIRSINFTNVRQLLQVIGTDLIRKYKPNWHVDCLVNDIKDYIVNNDVIVDDVRFPNEKNAIEQLDGKVFFIIRPNYFDVSNHISETSLRWQDFNDENIIINDLPQEVMIKHIQYAYANNFTDSTTKQPIFLSGCQYFKMTANPHFPNKSNNTALVQDFINEVFKDERFLLNGYIHYFSSNRHLRDAFNEEVLVNDCKNWQRDFCIYNPLINENLKFFIKN